MKLYKDFFRYVLPSMLAFALSGLYGIVDGFFLGNEMGDQALAAINVAYPLTAFLQAVGTGIGMGGAVQYTINKAQKKEENQQKCLGLTFGLLILVGTVLTPLFYFYNIPLLKALGASESLLVLGGEYMDWIAFGCLFQILGTGMVPFMRNLGNAFISMTAMMLGAVTNIVFDYLFIWVFHKGMMGAAIASVMGQVTAFFVCIIYLLWKKERMRLKGVDMDLLKKILLIGCSPFGLSFAPNLILILVNLNAVHYGGDFAVTCYAPVSYITYTVMLLLQGVSDGCQPLISFFYGKGERMQARRIYHMSRNFSLLTGGAAFFLLVWGGSSVIELFGTSERVTEYVTEILPIFLLGLLFAGVSRAVISYFYATEENVKAYFLIYGESVLLGILLWIVPNLMGILGTWISVMVSQLLIALLSQIFLLRAKRSG
ncbi:MAG: MATE family efflux transporter [Lachnospiraceae bacterium]|nr:MATE family efflux transporter [Lachnospiraceae bacterium]MDY5699847.1 MATE family efflux transporter [Lachnospiraceae bacterium]